MVMPVGRITDDWYFLGGIDVLAADTGGIVALGDSLTDAKSPHTMRTAAGPISSPGV